MKMYKFYNSPKEKSLSEYNNQRELFSLELKKIFWPEKFSLYLIWELGLPWVSDLDFLVIVENFVHKKRIQELSEKFSLIDKPLFISYDDLGSIEYFTHHTKFEYVEWVKCLESLNIGENKKLCIIYSRKILFCSALRNYYIPIFSKKIDIKAMLAQIYDLRYPIYYLGKICILDKRCWDFIESFEKFRNAWFKHKDQDKLVEYIFQAIDISYYLIEVIEKVIIVENGEKKYFYGRYPTIFMCIDKQNYKLYTEKYFKLYWNIDRFLVLPRCFDYSIWDDDLQVIFKKIIRLNPNFLKLGLDKRWLNAILLIKKIIDFLKIRIFVYYEKI